MKTPDQLSDAELTGILGAKCAACGWRGGRHRPGNTWQDPCPEGAK